MKPDALYIYLVGFEDRLRESLNRKALPSALEAERPLQIVSSGKLGAITSSVPLADYGEGNFETKLQDAAWAAEKVMRHQTVAQFFSAGQPVVPLRFGVLYSTEEKIQDMLKDRSSSLLSTLRRVEDCEEWGLSVYVDTTALAEEIVKVSPKLAELKRKAESSSEGQRYLLEKQAERMRASEMKNYLRQAADDITGSLKSGAKEMKRIAVVEHEARQSPAVAGKAAYLVAKSDVTSFKKAAEKSAARHAGSGVKLELTGPWPPYNFVE